MANLVMLNGAQLRQLAQLIYHQEAEMIYTIQFKSEVEQARFLDECRANRDSALALLDAGGKFLEDFKNDPNPDRASAAHDIYSIIQGSLNSAYQWVRNYTLRTTYLDKIKSNSLVAMDKLKNLKPNDTASARDIAEKADKYKKEMWKINKTHMSRRSAAVSEAFAKLSEGNTLTIEKVVKRIQKELNFDGPFKDLEDVQKLKVYERIIELSGEEKFVSNLATEVFGAAGVAVLLFAAGVLVWDIYTSNHKIETATHDVVVAAASFGGASLGEFVGTVATTALVGVETTVGAVIVAVAGLAFSFAGAIILGAFAGRLIDELLGSAGRAPLSTDGFIYYVAPAPDGEVLARQIAHQDKFTT